MYAMQVTKTKCQGRSSRRSGLYPWFANNGERTTLKAGEIWSDSVTSAPLLGYVEDGLLKRFHVLADGRRQIARFLYPNELLVLAADRGGRVPKVMAIVDASIMAAPLPTSDAGEEIGLLPLAVQEIARADAHMLLLARLSARQRLAHFLVGLHGGAARIGKDGEVAIPMTRRDIADHLGLEVETVSRAFTGLQKEGLIVIPDANSAQLLNVRQLNKLAQGHA
jgi:CRP-like cAMP-binding protein